MNRLLNIIALLLCVCAMVFIGVAVMQFFNGHHLTASLWLFIAHLCVPWKPCKTK